LTPILAYIYGGHREAMSKRIYQPNEGVPEDFLDFSKRLSAQETVSKEEFISICKLAIDIVEHKSTTNYGCSHMFYHIAGLWLSHKNIDNDDLLNSIGGQFGEWEIEGDFDLENALDAKRWVELKNWVAKAEAKYPDKSNG
jgi:hypothetical protein